MTTVVVALVPILTLALTTSHGVLDLALSPLQFSSQFFSLPLLSLELRLAFLLLDGLPILSLLTTLVKLFLGSISTSFRREPGLSLSEPCVQIGRQPMTD